jgi:threonine synthase
LRYISTRGRAPALDFEDVLLAGLANDGGLYVPEAWPVLDEAEIAALGGLTYPEMATRLMAPFIGDAMTAEEFAALVADAYAGFDHAAVAPLRQLDGNEWLLELFHGPTFAFKDIALQVLGRLFDHVLAKRGRRATVVGATSGDTGSAAIAACRGHEALTVFILHPKGRVSEVQRRQMTTVDDANVHNIAIDGTFDDCQAIVKAMFADQDFRHSHDLAAVNSINWARVMAQTVYYFWAALALGAPKRRISFAVPTGNFGDIFAGYVAVKMGLPVERLIIATNRNDIVARFLESGEYRTHTVVPTLSPSMDIQRSSNFERLLFDLCERNGEDVAACMGQLERSGGFTVGGNRLGRARDVFDAASVTEDETLETIAAEYRRTGFFVDPHTAVGIAAGRARRGDEGTPLVMLATAHAAKFPSAIEKATGQRPPPPPRLADIMTRPERCTDLPNDVGVVQTFIAQASP